MKLLLPTLFVFFFMVGCGEGKVEDISSENSTRLVIDCAKQSVVSKDNSSILSSVIDGYTDMPSYSEGQSVEFFINSTANMLASIPVYTMNGKIVDYADLNLVNQPIVQDVNAFRNGYNYCRSGYYKPRVDLNSGVYLLANKIPFIYNKKESAVDVVIVNPTNTYAAYNLSGGGSLYNGKPLTNFQVSFLRPTRMSGELEGFFKWIESNKNLHNMSVRYLADIDLDYYENIANAKVLIIMGHSEYWTREARQNFDRFINEGHHAIVLSGNTMWWQVRYSLDRKSLICHKSNSITGSRDPIPNLLLQTKNWFSSELKYPIINSLGVDFRYGGYGYSSSSSLVKNISPKKFNGLKVLLPSSPLLAGTMLSKGDILTLIENEVDGAPVSALDSEENPIIDTSLFAPYKFNLIGYDYAYLGAGYQSNTQPLANPEQQVWTPYGAFATWIVWQKSPSSGYIMNGAIQPGWTQWSAYDNTSNSIKMQKILENTINIFVQGKTPFVDEGINF